MLPRPAFATPIPLTRTRPTPRPLTPLPRPRRPRPPRSQRPLCTARQPPAQSPPPTPTHPAAPVALDNLLQSKSRRFIFVGGKGGVGKTTTAAAIAVHFANASLTTLVLSTDPAHSLGDALRIDLSDGALHSVPDLPLHAVEVDTTAAVAQFRHLLASLNEPPDDPDDTWRKIAARLGLSDFSAVLDTIPPGADELLALVSVLDLVESRSQIQFDRVVIDTAPTGHTLRLLAFPDFLDTFLAQALALREKLHAARTMLGSVANIFVGRKADINAALTRAAERVEAYRQKMVELSDLFRDPSRAEFIVVTIATVLAVEESKRLIQHLWDDGIWVRHIVVNQVLPATDNYTVSAYLDQLRKGQAREIAFATERIADEFSLTITLVPRFDTEVRGVYGLRALGQIAFKESRTLSYGLLLDEHSRATNGAHSQFVFVGGKGGVGKTSLGAALGIRLAEQGFKTLILSTDPAHSLADALNVSLKGGAPVSVDDAEGELFAMEIDTEGAIKDFQMLASDFVAEGRRGAGVDIARKLGLEEFAALLDNAPPGIDELVALTQVMELVKFGDFDRVVVDTAPTGHTLRLLSFPEFLDTFLGKVIRLKNRLDSAIDKLRSVIGRKDGKPDAVDKAAKGVQRLRENMEELRDLVRDKQRTQFAVVTVATGLAMAESERLVKSLKKDGVMVKNLIINQIIGDTAATAFVRRIIDNQSKCIEQLREAGAEKDIELTEVPYFDVERPQSLA
ncbi:putative arsenical pump-driving ATPase [Gracilariopsis chorda]|uniref:Putative arsenical pump-driving ATPase n=1 Tax=Gracilariopsis chorda TaxID=448386 RepID=A0A2V3IU97_9FLOR|nr:putative arsenical pump-driving ATPase [Gracilariopsis chorda]|eukprot:PXF45716.1 putative arsenical pump-driving ATPase [Gracilariopsis chorda]